MSFAATANMFPRETPHLPPQMELPLIFSVLFHFSVFFIGTLSLPFLRSEIPEIDNAIPVEIITVDEKSASDKKPAPAEKKLNEIKSENKEKPPPVPVAPKVLAKVPSKPIAPAPPEIALEAPKTEAPKKPAPQPKTKPKIEKKAPEPVKEQEEVKEEEFQGMLRNLMDPPQQQAAEESDVKDKGEEPSLINRFATRMTASEMAAVKQQLNRCWSVMAGARYAENLVVDIKLFMNPDATVKDARIIDKNSYNSDDYFRAAADNALRAIYSPQCNPLKLPLDKYDLWKEMNVRFDPSKVL